MVSEREECEDLRAGALGWVSGERFWGASRARGFSDWEWRYWHFTRSKKCVVHVRDGAACISFEVIGG